MNWLDRLNDVPGGNALRYYLGPAYEPVNALAQFGASMLPGADTVDMAENSQRLMDYQGPMETLGDAGWLGLSALGMALPGRPAAARDAVEGVRYVRKSPTMADAYVGDQFAGTVSLAEGKPFVSAVSVEPQFRGQGVGSGLYREAEAMAGRPLVPSPLGLTEDATSLWQRRLARMRPEDANRLIDESMELGRGYGIRDEHLEPRLGPLRQSIPAGPAGNALTEPQGITAYHGSPHDFDRFDMGKIGTGEGAQAYGHGENALKSTVMAPKSIKNLKGESVPPPTRFYRGTNPGDTRRIKTGADEWDGHLFVADNQRDAGLYGSQIDEYEAGPDAKILYEGTAEWVKIAGKWRKDENLLQYADRGESRRLRCRMVQASGRRWNGCVQP
jgi:GNAT superfamily N-acetyltransferase